MPDIGRHPRVALAKRRRVVDRIHRGKEIAGDAAGTGGEIFSVPRSRQSRFEASFAVAGALAVRPNGPDDVAVLGIRSRRSDVGCRDDGDVRSVERRQRRHMTGRRHRHARRRGTQRRERHTESSRRHERPRRDPVHHSTFPFAHGSGLESASVVLSGKSHRGLEPFSLSRSGRTRRIPKMFRKRGFFGATPQ